MIQTIYKNLLVKLTFGILLAVGAISIHAQTSAFTYQGRLTDNSLPPTGTYDFQFQLYNTLGSASGAAITVEDVSVTNGIFTVELDFGAGAFQQVLLTSRSMEIRVRPGTSTGAFTALAPRQAFTAAPIAIAATKAETATNAVSANNALALGGVTANQFVQTGDARLSDSRNPLAGSTNYIQNNGTANAQTGNFNISGNGKVGNTLTTFDAVISNDLTVQNDVTIQGVFTGNGVGITNLNASNITTGTLNSFRIPDLSASKITFGTFTTTLIPFLDASKITTGTFSDLRLSSNIPRKNAANSFTGNLEANDITANGNLATPGTLSVGGTFFGTTVNAATQYNIGGNSVISVGSSGVVNIGRTTDQVNVNYLTASNGLFLNSLFSNSVSGNTVNAVNQFNINGNRALSASGSVVTIGRPTDTTKVGVLQITGGSDLAEKFEINDDDLPIDAAVKPGMVVAIDPTRAGKITVSRQAYDRRVAGVISGANNVAAGMVLPDLADGKNSRAVALSGRVWVYADATRAPIQPGDLLTTSDTPGHAMRADDASRSQGAILGKAMTELKSGMGFVLILVTLQ